jgi:hypothetical protein
VDSAVKNPAILKADMVEDIIKLIETPGGNLPAINIDNAIFDEQDYIYQVDFATVKNWDQEIFVKASLRMMCNWKSEHIMAWVNELRVFLNETRLKSDDLFQTNLFVPTFSNSNEITDINMWLQELSPTIEIVSLVKDENAEAMLKACREFCKGKEDPKFMRKIPEDVPMLNGNQVVQKAEHNFKSFAKSLLGEFGETSFISLMNKLKLECTKDTKPSKSTAIEIEEAPAINQEKIACLALLGKLIGMVKQIRSESSKDVMSRNELDYFLTIVENRLDISTLEKTEYDVLRQLKSKVSANSNMAITQLTSTFELLVAEDWALAINIIQGLLNSHMKLQKGTTADTVNSAKKAIYQETLANISIALQKRPESTVEVGKILFENFSVAFDKIYPNHTIYGCLNLAERSITALAKDGLKITDEDGIAGNALIEEHLRIVACSPNCDSKLLGAIKRQGKCIDYQAIETNGPIKVNNAEETILGTDPFVIESRLLELTNTYCLLSLPLSTKENESSFGTLDLLLKGAQEKFDVDDVKFVEKVASKAYDEIKRIERRNCQMDIILSSIKFFRLKFDQNVQVFTREKDVVYQLAETMSQSTDTVNNTSQNGPIMSKIETPETFDL